ncbi:MOSC domain-containing protein [Pontibacter sp. JAM-7]|uniref:MOSC domain-containing protein n=1 Tax=Pontibacter sp. JAM-7 TaxID=3366581 RepID=UPI003AF9E623
MPVSRLDSIHIYPVKSCAPIQLSAANIDPHGLPFDRRLILSSPDGAMLTAREIPKLLLFKALLLQDGIEIIAPDGEHITLRYPELIYTYHQVNIWGDEVNAQSCGETLDNWFSDKLQRPCRLLYFGEQSQRYTSRRPAQGVAFADGYPLLLISQASLDDLNQRSTQPVSMAHFRPNLVVTDTMPFAEDHWRKIRIGEVEFDVVKPCSRCVMTTYDPLTADKVANAEPLKTLINFRRGQDGEVYFGQNLVALNQGCIQQGDRVEVLEIQTPEVYPASAPLVRPTSAVQQHTPDAWSDGQVELTCTARIQETPDVITFRFSQPENYCRTEYQAGQFITLSVPLNGTTERCYTLSSSPSRNSDIAITVKQVNAQGVSAWLHQHLQPGGILQASPPRGQFHVNSSGQAALLLLSAGSGITPLLSMVRDLTDSQSQRDLVFFHQARHKEDLICQDELLWLARQNPRLKLIFCLSQPDAGWSGVTGHLSRETLLQAVPDLLERAVYCCGPNGFMQTAKGACRQIGLAEQQWFQESFNIVPPQQETDAAESALNICFNHAVQVTGNNREPILQQAEANGIGIAYGCRAGICGTCKVQLESGEVERLSELPLSDAEKAAGVILACSCIPQSDLEITLPDSSE